MLKTGIKAAIAAAVTAFMAWFLPRAAHQVSEFWPQLLSQLEGTPPIIRGLLVLELALLSALWWGLGERRRHEAIKALLSKERSSQGTSMDPTYRLPAPIEVAGVYWDPEILDSDKGLEVVKAPDPLCPEHRRLLFVGDNNKYRCLTKDCPFVAPFNSSQIYNVWKELGNEIRGNYRVMDGKLVAFKFGVRN